MKSLSVAKALMVIICINLLSGCVLHASAPSPSINAFIYDPPDGSVVQVGDSVSLEGHAYSYIDSRDISHLLFFASGISLGEAPTLVHDTADAHRTTGSLDWTPTSTGEYSLQIMAVKAGSSFMSNAVRVCVIDFLIDPGSRYAAAFGYDGPCMIPDRDTSAIPGTLILTASATPDHLEYDAAYGYACPDPTLSFTATTTDPHEDVAFVTVALNFTIGPGTGPDMTFILTPTSTSPSDRTLFSGSVTYLYGNLVTRFGSTGGNVTWTAQALGRDGSILATDGPYTIPANPCTPVPLNSAFTLPAPTTTPASAVDCPSGTYFADVTHKCIPIAIPTKGKQGGNGASTSCSSYQGASACTTNGCSWDKITSTCH